MSDRAGVKNIVDGRRSVSGLAARAASGPQKRVLSRLARLQKLRVMSLAEVASRVHDRVFTHVERTQHRLGRFSRPARLRDALDPSLGRHRDWRGALLAARHARRPRFFAGAEDRAAMQRLFDGPYAAERADTRARAAAVRRHEFSFFGRTFQSGPRVDWLADPVSGRRWPHTFHADVPIDGGDVGFGDVKYVWELNRHQFLVDLAKHRFLEEDPADAAEIRTLVHDWIEQNPYGTGVNWSSPLEPAFRVLSWLWAYHLCLDDPGLDADAHLLWLEGFSDHGRFLHRHLEHFASPFNHLVGEAAALYLLGVLFPELREAAAWRARGRRVLESRLGEQFYADGGGVEQATFYHHATLGFYLLAAVLGRSNGEDLAEEVWAAIERAIEHAMYMTQPDGRVPAIGDADDGKPIRMEHAPFWDFRAFQAIGAVIYGRPDFKHVAGRFHEDALWLLGPAGLQRFDALASAPPRETSKALPSSGYYVLRSDWSARGDFVLFDCGELAFGARHDDIPNAVHGHADCLSITVLLRGQPVLVDAGFYTYNGAAEWEHYFRRTAAHNTARVDRRDQAKHLTKMAWSHAPRAALEEWKPLADQAAATGSHDGFARTPDGVVHRRSVWLRPGGYVIVYDEFEGGGEHDLEIAFHFPPGRATLDGPAGLTFDDRALVRWIGTAPFVPLVRAGGERPEEGWIAPSLGVRVAAPRLTLTSRLTGGRAACLTAIADASRVREMARAETIPREGATALGLTVRGADYVDWILAPGGRPAAIGRHSSGARLAVWRDRNGRIVEANHIGEPHTSG